MNGDLTPFERAMNVVKKWRDCNRLLSGHLGGSAIFAAKHMGFHLAEAYYSTMDNLIAAEQEDRMTDVKPAKGDRGFVIDAPDYLRRSAGVVVLHRLCHDLNALGYPAFVRSNYSPRHLCAPTVSLAGARKLAKNGFVAVYPEITVGNPFRATKIMRWVLNAPGLIGGDAVFDDAEQVFYYADVFRASIRNRTVGKLFMPVVERDLFHDGTIRDEERTLECYYTGKSGFRPGYVNVENMFEITRRSPCHEDLPKLFRHSKALYTFDNTTSLTHEALMCGCRVVLIPDGTQTRESIAAQEYGDTGITWFEDGISPLGHAEISQAVLKRIEALELEYAKELKHMVSVFWGGGR